MIYYQYNYIKKSYNFNITLNYNFNTRKNQASVTLAMVHVIVTTPLTTNFLQHKHACSFW
jgi:hypothetical protein